MTKLICIMTYLLNMVSLRAYLLIMNTYLSVINLNLLFILYGLSILDYPLIIPKQMSRTDLLRRLKHQCVHIYPMIKENEEKVLQNFSML